MVTIRNETEQDAAAIGAVNEKAFKQPAEAALVQALRKRGAVSLSLVAIENESIVGHILFTPAVIVSESSTHPVVALGPMAVLPAQQRCGIGTQLMRHGLDVLRDDGHGAVIVLGHPEYYPRFGFSPASKFGLHCTYDVPDDVSMNALRDVSGTARYQPEFDGL